MFPLGFADTEKARQLGITVSSTQARSSGRQLQKLGRLFDAGTIRVVIDNAYPLAKAREAHERAARGNIQGKLVLTVA